jgi:Tol biopolymer transport system component
MAGSDPRAEARPLTVAIALLVALGGLGLAVLALRDQRAVQRLPGSPANSTDAVAMPANGLIAFGCGYHICTMFPDGSNITDLIQPYDPSIVLAAYDPVWSPDGTRIAFYGYPRGAVQGGANYDVYVMNADGSGVTNLTTTPADVASWFSQLNPKWSPDGTRITYDGDDGLYIMNVDGSDQTRIASGQDATWSPDGTRLAFAGEGGIFAVAPDGTDLDQLTSGPGFAEFPAYSPDGSRIAYLHSQGDDRAIYTMNVDGSDSSLVAGFQADTVGRPEWSPDASMLAFDLYFTNQTWDIYAVNSDGSGLAPLADDPSTDEVAPVWSPDGTVIAFHASDVLSKDTDNTGTFDIHLMNPDGTDQIPLTHDLGTSGGGDVHWQELPSDLGSASASAVAHLSEAHAIEIPLPGGGDPFDVDVIDGAVWVTSNTGLYRVDLATSEAVNVLPNDYFFRVSSGYGALWITTGSDGRVLRVDPQSQELTAAIDVGAGPVTDVAVSEDGVWASASSDLVRIDPATNAVVDRLGSDRGFGAIAFGPSGLWVIAGAGHDGEVWQIDPATSDVQQRIPLANPSFWNTIAVGDEAVWVTSSPTVHGDGTALVHLHRIDPSSGDITADIPLGEGASGLELDDGAVSYSALALGEGYVWTLVSFEGLLRRLDTRDLSVSDTEDGIACCSGVGPGMIVGAGSVWITGPGAITRISLQT